MHSCIPSYHELQCDEFAESSGSVHPPHHENCGTSQAFCTPMMNLPTVSGSEHFLRIPLTKIVGRLRLFSTPMMKLPIVSGSVHFFVHSTHKSWGTSQARCTPTAHGRQSQAPSTFCALRSRKLRDVSGFLHPHDKTCRPSQALCTPLHEICGTSQALCTPMMKIADRLTPCTPPRTKIAGRLRLCAPPTLNLPAV